MNRILLPALALGALLAALPARALDVHKPEVQQFISEMVHKHHYPRAKLVRLLKATPIDPHIIHAIEHPAEALPWYKYRAIFITRARIAAGKTFVGKHAKPLDSAWNRYGVPPEIVAALLGMESYYGTREGTHSALTALSTLTFAYPRRTKFFRQELVDYLLLCRRNHLDPATVKGSYAGALGAGQFMPSTYLAYAVDVDGGGSDLFSHWPDITASVAHYLASHGWRRDEPVAAPAAVPAQFNGKNLEGRTLSAHELKAYGVVFDAPVAATAPVRLVKTMTRKGPKYWVGLPNFSVLMTYNNSALYALAAAQLAGEIEASSGAGTVAGNSG